MRADRLITTLLLLQNRGRMSARELAEELEVSTRTVMRDLEALGMAGVPIYSERGPAGGFELWPGFRASLTSLTGEEAVASVLSGIRQAAVDLDLADDLDRFELKLHEALPPALADARLAAANRFLVALQPADDPNDALRFFTLAVDRSREVELTAGGSEPRIVHSHGLVRTEGGWWIVFAEEDGFAGLPLSDIDTYRTTGARFERADGFDLAAVWAQVSAGGDAP